MPPILDLAESLAGRSRSQQVHTAELSDISRDETTAVVAQQVARFRPRTGMVVVVDVDGGRPRVVRVPNVKPDLAQTQTNATEPCAEFDRGFPQAHACVAICEVAIHVA